MEGPVMTAKVLYNKRGEVAYITLNRPEVKNAIDIESHELLCDIWRDFRDDPGLRVAVITGTGDAFTAGADLKTHAPEWQTIGPMVGRERLEDGLCGITRGPLSRITKPIVAAINGWCVGHGVELAMACDIRIASEMWGYALCGGNTTVMERSQQFFDKVDRGRAGTTSTPL
jgi:enoyl-CoA hydratase/carnithine racemase